jgi:hypothetical protein
MNKKYLFFFCALLFAIIFTSCKEDIKGKVEKGVRDHLENVAFKLNKQMTILELDIIYCYKTGENSLDSMRRISLQKQIDYFLSLREIEIDQAKLNKEQTGLYYSLGSSELANISKSDFDENIAKAKTYGDSISVITKQDSIIMERMSKRTSNDPANYYKTKCFLKAKIDSENLLDTFYFILNNKYQVLPLN